MLCVCCRFSPHPDMLVCVCYRSAALYSSAVGRATYCRAPFLALVCPTSLGVVFSLSALVSTVCTYCYKYMYIYIAKWKTEAWAKFAWMKISCWQIPYMRPWPHTFTSPLFPFFSSTTFLICCSSYPCSLHISHPYFNLSPTPFFFGLFNPFLQHTTAASQSCQPSLMWEPLNCRPLATRSSIHVSRDSTWPVDQSTGPAGPMGAGQGNHLSAQVQTRLYYIQKGTWRYNYERHVAPISPLLLLNLYIFHIL